MAEQADSAIASPAVPIAPVLFKARGRGKVKANMRKRSPSPPPTRRANDDSDSDSDGGSDSDNAFPGSGRAGIRETKRRRRNGAGVISASTDGTAAAATAAGNGAPTGRELPPQHVTDRGTLLADADVATKQSHLFDEEENSRNKAKKGALTAPTPAAAPTRAVGPVKAASNIRTITITDYSPDVCKDYKLTGFCGFGDSCKFLHARENFKQGWQLDNEWEAVTKGKKHLGGTVVASADRTKRAGEKGKTGDDDDDDDDEEAMLRDIPFACIICRKSYTQPVVTRCGHYFCERCALERYRRDPTCAACGAATTGVFNNAKRLTKLLERKRERAAKRRQAAIEAGEEVSSEEEESGSE
ncbi:ccch and ring finger protein [Niveomyces insectorum RCEF 264]|uniref:Pre-mRNA-splicing factor CWC24 n=1 Tax=Niveomyces insectorum RCEF 264 TaxID=1081102 RepID=A0A167W5I0_9HYPO|nr:ccch and ring finger protein [Niveomyces insectorum RCEF 264]